VQRSYDANSQEVGRRHNNNYQLDEEGSSHLKYWDTIWKTWIWLLQARPGRKESGFSVERLENLDFDLPDMVLG